MRKFFLIPMTLLLFPLAAPAAEWTGYLMDTMCVPSKRDQPAAHTAECMRGCQKSGFGLITADGKYIKFDEAGNAKALKQLELSKKEDNLLVKVNGQLKGGMIQVDSVVLE